MRFMRAKTVVLALAILVGAGATCLAEAGSAGAPSNGVKKNATESLFQPIIEGRKNLDDLKAKAKRASGVDREALEQRAADRAVKLVKKLHSIAEDLDARQKAGEDVTVERKQARKYLEQTSPLIRSAIIRLENTLGRLISERDEAPPEDVPEIERRIESLDGRVNRALGLLLRQIQVLDQMSLPTEKDKTFLSKHLQARATLLAGRVELTRSMINTLWGSVRAKPDDTALKAKLKLKRTEFDRQVESLKTTVGMMEAVNMDTAEYRQLLFKTTGRITTGLLKKDVLTGLSRSLMESVTSWITQEGPRVIFKVIVFLLILLVFRLLAIVSRKLLTKVLDSSRFMVSHLLKRTALSMTGTAVMILGLLVALSQIGVDMTPLLATVGIAGLVVGFALQDSLANFAAGVMILIYHPYDVGDLIHVAGTEGKVENMTLVATTLLTFDHQTLVVPNNKIWGDVIRNVTAQATRRVDLVFGISYSDHIEHAEKVLWQILRSHAKVLDNPEPIVKVHNLGDSSVDFVVRPWVRTEDYWNVYWDITREVKMRFDAEGISIPYPQQDVHLIEKKTGANE